MERFQKQASHARIVENVRIVQIFGDDYISENAVINQQFEYARLSEISENAPIFTNVENAVKKGLYLARLDELKKN